MKEKDKNIKIETLKEYLIRKNILKNIKKIKKGE
jgi:hypothetical protein